MFLQQLLNGIILGSTYSLIAIGYTLIFGVLKILHLAHGEVFMAGAFVGLQLVLLLKFNILNAIIGSMILTAILGVIIEKVALKPIRDTGHHLMPIISTLAVAIILQDLSVKIFGSEQVGFPDTVKIVIYRIGNLNISSIQIFIIGVAFLLMFLLNIFIFRTNTGTALRATADCPRTASLMGINVDRIIMFTFAISSAFAGAAGVLVGLSYNAISPFMGVVMGLKGLVIMLLGGLGNVKGAMVGGLILGMIEVMSVAYLASSYRDAFAFIVMILIIIIRPTGLFGTKKQQLIIK